MQEADGNESDARDRATGWPVLLLLGLQHTFLITVSLLISVTILRACGVPENDLPRLLGWTLISLAVVNVMMVVRVGPIGTGVFLPMQPTAVLLAPALQAAAIGQLGLVAGMTCLAGVVLIGLAPLLRRLRPFFPTEIAGLVIVVIGIDLANRGVTQILGESHGAALSLDARGVVGGLTLATMIVFSVWLGSRLRNAALLAGLCVGGISALMFGAAITTGDAAAFAMPAMPDARPSFDPGLAIVYVISALALIMATMGNVATAQQISDPAWVRPRMRSIQGGVMATGIGLIVSAFAGAPGVGAGSSNVGLARATGVADKRLIWVIAGALLVAGLSPAAMSLLLSIPEPVIGAAWMVMGAHVFVSGMVVMTSRIIDVRKALVIGLSLPIGLSAQIYPEVYAGLPEVLHPLTTQTLVLGTLSAIVLNAVFRIGIAQRVALTLDGRAPDAPILRAFMRQQGGAWAARADVIDKATFTLAQLVEMLRNARGDDARLEVLAEFDEFSLRISVTHPGPALEFPTRRPSPREIVASDDGANLLAGFLVRKSVQTLTVTSRDEFATVALRFEH